MKSAFGLPVFCVGWMLATVFFAGCSSTSEKAPPAQVDMEAMMKQMVALAKPGPEHAAIAKNTGRWQSKYEHKMGADAPWSQSTGITNAKMILDGRFLYEEIAFHMPELPPEIDQMSAVHIFGYDNMKHEYESHWMDSMSTWMIHSRGKAAADGTIQLKGTMVDVTGSRPFRMVLEDRPDGSRYMEMYDTVPGVGEVLTMKSTSTRM